jgi:phosphatidylglycerol---prolipoprotein diacylglyceryl transferase
MYPLISIGPLNLNSGGLLTLFALFLASWLFERFARRRAGKALADHAGDTFLPALLGAILGARLWYGLLNWDLYSANPSLFWALRFADLAWPGALLGGALAGWLWCAWRRYDAVALADAAALALPLPQALAGLGLLLSGEAFGQASTLPWAIPLFGTMRHPTQIYFVLAALSGFALLRWFARREPAPGRLAELYLGWQGLTLLFVEALRADSLTLPGGIRAAQMLGLALLLLALQKILIGRR